jgi:D-alanyl-D-alanine carboxypeptidase (penicillin-binding protein 5/6)
VLGLAATVVVGSVSYAAPAAAAQPASPVVGGERLGSAGLVVDAPGAEPLPEVTAAAWLLADLDTGEVLAAKDPHGRLRPASTLKILTALTLLPELDPAATYVAQWEDANSEGSRVGVVPDASYSVHNLFEALFLVSGNDAASALANAAGGVETTVAAMNRTARDLGALDTTAANPSGLDAPGQYTSAYDLALLTRAAMAREDFRAYAATVKSQFPGKPARPGKVRKTFEIYTQDRLLLNYRGAIGVKTGWTTKARGTFVGAATRGGRTLVATVLRTDADGWREAGRLLTWGFRNGATVRPVGSLEPAAAPGARDSAVQGPMLTEDAAAAGAAADTAGLPWWAQVPLVLLGLLVALRTRVLVRRHLRKRRRRGGPVRLERLPQPRDFRRDTTAAAAAPRPAPTAAPRHPIREPVDMTSSASTGTGS